MMGRLVVGPDCIHLYQEQQTQSPFCFVHIAGCAFFAAPNTERGLNP